MANSNFVDLIMSELSEDIGEEVDTQRLLPKVRNAIREVEQARNYPATYTDEQKKSDLKRYISNIEGIAMFDYNQIGAEGEAKHSENGTSREYINRNTYFYGITPIARCGK